VVGVIPQCLAAGTELAMLKDMMWGHSGLNRVDRAAVLVCHFCSWLYSAARLNTASHATAYLSGVLRKW
jgi:hypothetical protein